MLVLKMWWLRTAQFDVQELMFDYNHVLIGNDIPAVSILNNLGIVSSEVPDNESQSGVCLCLFKSTISRVS